MELILSLVFIRMFRSIQFVMSACLLGTHRSLFGTLNNSKKKSLGEIVSNSLLSQRICMVSSERGPQRIYHDICEPKDSKYVSQKPLKKSFSRLVNTSCSISPADTTGFQSVCEINTSIQYSSNTTFSDHFILRDHVSNKCLLPENHTGKHRRSVDKWRADRNSSRKSQSYHNTRSTSFAKAYELSKGLWTSYRERFSHPGPLKSQMCGLHRRVPQQAAFEDCVSAHNEDRCRSHLQANAALYEKERGKSRAAVLVSLCTVGGEPALLFTLRSSKLRGRHKGDVRYVGFGLKECFPNRTLWPRVVSTLHSWHKIHSGLECKNISNLTCISKQYWSKYQDPVTDLYILS